EYLFGPPATGVAEGGAPPGVVEQLGDQFGEAAEVAGGGEQRRVARPAPGRGQVEGDDRPRHRHVLAELHHRGEVVEGVLRVGGEADVRGGEDGGEWGLRDSARA